MNNVSADLAQSPACGTIEQLTVFALKRLKPAINYTNSNADIVKSAINRFGVYHPIYINRRDWTILNPDYAEIVLYGRDSGDMLPVMMFDVDSNMAKVLSIVIHGGLDHYLTAIPDVDAVMNLIVRLLNTDYQPLSLIADSDYIKDAMTIYFDEVPPIIKIDNEDETHRQPVHLTISQLNDYGIPVLNLDFQILEPIPFDVWRRSKDVEGVHFYMDDYRFESLFSAPGTMTHAHAIEANISLSDDKPLALVIYDTWRKRTLSKKWQERGVNIAVDLNVPRQYAHLNLAGVPSGWRSYANRAYVDDLEHLDYMYDLVLERAGRDDIIYMVYSSSKIANAYINKRGWILVEDSFKRGT